MNPLHEQKETARRTGNVKIESINVTLVFSFEIYTVNTQKADCSMGKLMHPNGSSQ